MVQKKGLHRKAKRNLLQLQQSGRKARSEAPIQIQREIKMFLSAGSFYMGASLRAEGLIVSIVEEDFTTKTCTQCGNCENDVGSKKIFNCSSCKFQCDR